MNELKEIARMVAPRVTAQEETKPDRKCVVCHAAERVEWHIAACRTCLPVWRVCYGSAGEAIRFEIKKYSAEELTRCLDFERAGLGRTSLIRAIETRLRVLARQANQQPRGDA